MVLTSPFSVAYDHLKRLRAAANANEKRLLELLETEHAEMLSLLHVKGLNYYYWYKTCTKLRQTPRESLRDAAKTALRHTLRRSDRSENVRRKF
ncbi:unnamed protein product [Caenorhabditis auriculariae]|uniref:Uncharacterized protein n=1 Tax=Caenorhabditis auriculariae TaxID=2777116 RepID=A0A8S1HX86_9PELO|nr:unnamed protein product [Caenorhabditis auriculariae]